jgi:exoribonuclease-2
MSLPFIGRERITSLAFLLAARHWHLHRRILALPLYSFRSFASTCTSSPLSLPMEGSFIKGVASPDAPLLGRSPCFSQPQSTFTSYAVQQYKDRLRFALCSYHTTHRSLHTWKSPSSATAAAAGRKPKQAGRPFVTDAKDVARAQDEADTVGIGRFVHFRKENTGASNNGFTTKLGRVLRRAQSSGTQWEMEDEHGVVYSVKERDVSYVLPSETVLQTTDFAAIARDAADKEQHCLSNGLMAVAWEVSDAGAIYTVKEMSELLFASSTPAACCAAHRLLEAGTMYFKQVGRRPPMYAARSPTEVESLQRAEEIRRSTTLRLEMFKEAVQAAKQLLPPFRPPPSQWLQGPHAEIIRALEAFAFGKPSPPPTPSTRGKESISAINILAALGVSKTPQGVVTVLQNAGYWKLHSQLNLLAGGLTEEFSPELETEADIILAGGIETPDPDAHWRQDLTHLKVITIDDAETTEIDDGLSAQVLSSDGTTRVYIHIADPTRWIPLNSPLDLEARRRSKTLYLPTGNIPMFPRVLATGPFSLREGVPCCALTVIVTLDGGGMVRGGVEIVPSLIQPSQRLTYELVDEMLMSCSANEEPEVHALMAMASARKELRKARGAVDITMPEPQIVLASDWDQMERPEVDVRIDQGEDDESHRIGGGLGSGGAHTLVAEMMILAGEVCAKVAASNGVPLPYRGQALATQVPEEELEALPPGPCRMVALRSRMSRSVTTADQPSHHAGLGLDAYTQVTSPIRRYGDLLVHYQLKAALRGEKPPLTVGELDLLLSEVGTTTQRVTKLERDAQGYWIALYFKNWLEKDARRSWKATFLGWLKQENGLARVLLNDLGLETIARIVRPATPGTKLIVRCSSADPGLGIYRLTEAHESFALPNDTYAAAA